jgi:hypothetical protein
MTRLPALAALVLCLAGCFVFDNPIENAVPHTPTTPPTPPTPTAAFQIVVTSDLYGGTYVWNSADSAYEAVVANARYYVYLDNTGYWVLGNQVSTSYSIGGITHSVYAYGALPPTTNSGWSPTGGITSVDDSTGGISGPVAPDLQVNVGQVLHVSFLASDPGNSATYLWMSSTTQGVGGQNLHFTGSTYTIAPGDLGHWISVVVTPTDSTGTIPGTPVVSPPVMVK